MLDALTANDSREDLLLLILTFGWNEYRDRLPDGLVGAVAKQTLSAFVPRQDDALQRLADDGVLRRFNDRRQVGAREIRALALGYVAKHQHCADRGPGLVPNGRGAVVDRMFFPRSCD